MSASDNRKNKKSKTLDGPAEPTTRARCAHSGAHHRPHVVCSMPPPPSTLPLSLSLAVSPMLDPWEKGPLRPPPAHAILPRPLLAIASTCPRCLTGATLPPQLSRHRSRHSTVEGERQQCGREASTREREWRI